MILLFFAGILTTSISMAGEIDDVGANYLKAVRAKEATQEFHKNFRTISFQDLKTTLKEDDNKKAFWLNLYNALVIDSLRQDPKQYENRSAFFSKKIVAFKDLELSLDDIEHGILRGSRSKFGLGYLPRFFSGKQEQELKVSSPDFRIHFALNCGAESCPAIQFYDFKKVNSQLEKAMLGFLEQDVSYNKEDDELLVSRIFLWFHGDFGGSDGIRTLVKDKLGLPLTSKTNLRYKPYDWTLKID